ncbi:MAG TPA: hypothetical protein PLM20_09050 [Syntrophomonadaceae bacterium]|nr:hypothetical protein [Syntrophomonadaceae bacterium]HQA08325.1 hypothetical protein [Syntrophomonadaceae bacterium]HQE24035.1 hypothetical protein [Syntrophomonadaceae bacterium]
MSDPNVATQAPPDAEAMQAIMAKIARVQKILGFLACCQLLLALFFLATPFLPAALGVSAYAFGFMLLAPFLLGLSYAAYLAKKDLSFAKVVFRNTAISQIGFLLIALYGYFTAPSLLILILAAIALILGGLACLVIYQASKQ